MRKRLTALWLRLIAPLGPPHAPAPGAFGLVRGGRVRRWLQRLILGRRVAVFVRIEGDVQGVGYRAWLRRSARRHGVRGWVRNVTDGSVEALLLGRVGRVERLARRCWRGPRRGVVWALHARLVLERPRGTFEVRPSRVAPGSTEHRFLAVRERLGELLAEPNRYDERRAGNLHSLRRAAAERNLYASRPFRAGATLLVLASPSSATAYSLTTRADLSEIDFAQVRHKDLARERLLAAGLPVAHGATFTRLDEALEWFRAYAHPVVVKPTSASKGRGVSVDVRTAEDLAEAWERARAFGERVIVEELVRGMDLRVTVVAGTAVNAMIRFPAHVVGDGHRSVAALHTRRDRLRRRNPRLRKGRLPIDAGVRRTLWRQGYRLDDVPAEGAVVFLSLASNTSRGAEGINVLPLVHPDVLLLAEQACEVCAPSGVIGMDLMLERIDLPRHEQRCVVGEVNMNPTMYGSEFPMYGAPVDVAAVMLRDAFPERAEETHYPLQHVRIALTGPLTEGLEAELRASATRHEVALERLEPSGTEHARIALAGHAHRLRGALEAIGVASADDGGVVDGWRLEPADALLPVSGAAWDVRAAPEDGPPDSLGPAWDLWVCAERLRRRGLASRERDGWLLELDHGARRALSGIWHASRFARQATRTREAAWALARQAGLRVPPGRTYRLGEFEGASEALRRYGLDAVLVDVATGGVWRVRSQEDLQRRWPQGGRARRALRLERHVPGCRLAFAVVDGRVAGAVRCDGVRPGADGDHDAAPDYAVELEAFERVCALAPGADVHHDWAGVVVRAVAAVEGLRYAVVMLSADDPLRPPQSQDWCLLGIDAHPSAQRFHRPDTGAGADVLAVVIERLLLGERIRWYAPHGAPAPVPEARP